MFDVRYQLRLNEIFDLASTSVLYYNMIQRHLSLIEETLVSNPLDLTDIQTEFI